MNGGFLAFSGSPRFCANGRFIRTFRTQFVCSAASIASRRCVSSRLCLVLLRVCFRAEEQTMHSPEEAEFRRATEAAKQKQTEQIQIPNPKIGKAELLTCGLHQASKEIEHSLEER